jgi:hypothetical protein
MNPMSAMSASPPLPPDVLQQQVPPAMQFMQRAGAGQAMQQFSALDMVKGNLMQIISLLKEVGEVLVIERPALMKHLQIMAQAGSAIMNELQAGSPEDTPQQQMPTPQDAAGAVSMS